MTLTHTLVPCQDLLRALKHMRPYKAPAEVEAGEFMDQVGGPAPALAPAYPRHLSLVSASATW